MTSKSKSQSMGKFFGYIFSTLGLIGVVFFSKYKGTAIPIIGLWFVLTFIIGTIGAFFIVRDKFLTESDNHNTKSRLTEIEQLRRTGEKVRVTLDNSDIKTRSYQQEIIQDRLPTRIEMVDALYDGNRNYKTETIQQTYILFQKKYGDTTFKFVSQSTGKDPDILKKYVDNQKGVDLYIDTHNRKNYHFDLPFA